MFQHWGAAVNEQTQSPAPVEHRSWRMFAGLSVPSSQGQVWFSGLMRTGQHSHAEKHPHSCVWLQLVPELPVNGFSEPQAALTHHLSALLPSQLGRLFFFFFFLDPFQSPNQWVCCGGRGSLYSQVDKTISFQINHLVLECGLYMHVLLSPCSSARWVPSLVPARAWQGRGLAL